MNMIESFHGLVGGIIQNCGAIECIVNELIKTLSTDSILAEAAVKQPLRRRTDLLRDLLIARHAGIDRPEVTKLIRDLGNLAQKRNDIAHNPIARQDGCGEFHVMCIKVRKQETQVVKYYAADLQEVARSSLDILKRLGLLVPQGEA